MKIALERARDIIQLKEPVKSIWQEWIRWFKKTEGKVTFKERTQALLYANQGIRPRW